MTPATHYREGERLLAVADETEPSRYTAWCLDSAAVHFAAAQVAATLAASITWFNPYSDSPEMDLYRAALNKDEEEE